MLDAWFEEEELTEEAYLANAVRLRKELDAMIPAPDDAGEDVMRYLASNEDARTTYDVYLNNILEHDLVNVHSSQSNQKAAVADRMILRGKVGT